MNESKARDKERGLPSSQCHQAGVSTVEFHQVTFHQKSQNMAQLCPNNQEEGFNLVEMILPNKILALPPGISNLEQIQKLCQNITSHTSHLYKSLQVDVYGRFITLLKPGSNQHAPHSSWRAAIHGVTKSRTRPSD